MVKLENIRIAHFQYFSSMILMLFLSFMLYPGKRRMDNSSTVIGLLHMGSFAADFGAKMWVTLVAGLTMFYSLPRHMFGQVQSRLFPMFFLWSLVTSAITLGTFVLKHPVDTWQRVHLVEASALLLCLVSAALNSLVVAPLIVSAMVKTFRMEVEAGVGGVVGYADMKEMKKNPEYLRAYRTFRRSHGASALLTLISLAANCVHLYYLTCQCVPL